MHRPWVANMPTWAEIFSDGPRGAGSLWFDVSDVAGELYVAACMFAGVRPLRGQALEMRLVALVAEWSRTAHTATLRLQKRGVPQRIGRQLRISTKVFGQKLLLPP